MRLLILGGTVFLGRHVVDAALSRGHSVTLFTRGQHNPDLFPDVEHLRGDRNGDLAALRGRQWDAVIDTSGYVPRVVRASAELLAAAVERYVFISSISVYADVSTPGVTEEAAVGTLADATTEEVTGESYGPLKALCEQAVEQALPGRALIIRPGLIVGPNDPTDRFTYWPHRVAAGGAVLAPGNPNAPVQFIDVRDLAEWIVRMVEAQQTGTYHATGPAQPMTMAHLLARCASLAQPDATLTWVAERFLLDAHVEPWSEMPLWVPESDASFGGFSAVNCAKAIAAGLTFRPLDETVRATLAWDATRPADHEWRAGITREREAALLAAWQGRAH